MVLSRAPPAPLGASSSGSRFSPTTAAQGKLFIKYQCYCPQKQVTILISKVAFSLSLCYVNLQYFSKSKNDDEGIFFSILSALQVLMPHQKCHAHILSSK
jgi:hypothetical protein